MSDCEPQVYRNYFAPVYEDGKVVQHGQTSDRMMLELDPEIILTILRARLQATTWTI